jgi:hypothetical protein
MKVGDLVKHKIVISYGVGLVTHIFQRMNRAEVLWSINKSVGPTAEMNNMLETVSESR